MLKILLICTLLLSPAISYIWSRWNLRCYMYSSRLPKRPYHSGPYFKYCAIEYWKKGDGYEYVAAGYNYMLGTNDELIDEMFENGTNVFAVRVEKEKLPNEPDSRLYVCRTYLCNLPQSPSDFLVYNEFLMFNNKTKRRDSLIWEDKANDYLIFRNSAITKKKEDSVLRIID